MAGRKPLPTNIKLVKGTDRKSRSNPNEPKLPTFASDPPEFLSPSARMEWDKKVKVLLRVGVMTEGDDTALAAYCQAFARFLEAEQGIKKSGLLIKTKQGNVIQNPLIGVANRALDLMHKFMTEFGLTPSSRSRISVNSPGKQSDEWEGFGT